MVLSRQLFASSIFKYNLSLFSLIEAVDIPVSASAYHSWSCSTGWVIILWCCVIKVDGWCSPSGRFLEVDFQLSVRIALGELIRSSTFAIFIRSIHLQRFRVINSHVSANLDCCSIGKCSSVNGITAIQRVLAAVRILDRQRYSGSFSFEFTACW
ncbi:hypothetical protein D3C74_368150 [compost metagenome]